MKMYGNCRDNKKGTCKYLIPATLHAGFTGHKGYATRNNCDYHGKAIRDIKRCNHSLKFIKDNP